MMVVALGSGGCARAAGATRSMAAGVAGSGQGEAAAAAEAAVGLFPRSSLSSHLRGSSLLSFFK